MRVLGIESSCDETSASVVEDGRKILSNLIYSQQKDHAPFRGIVPEIASREHVEKINSVISDALKNSKEKPDAIAVTVGPGLVGSLIVGKMTAEALGWMWGLPVIGVNHLEAHVFSALLAAKDLEPPFIGLVVSGGHTDLIHVQDYGAYKILGRTRDDAAGESFDKVANLLGLGYPGGPAIDRLSKEGDPKRIPLPKPHMRGSWDFSFSGIKTSVLYLLKDRNPAQMRPAERQQFTADVCASFQASVVEVLVEKSLLAAKRTKIPQIAVGGGVSANRELRSRFATRAKEEKVKVHFPSPELSTDNAAMIASIGYYKFITQKGAAKPGPLRVDPSLPIHNWS